MKTLIIFLFVSVCALCETIAQNQAFTVEVKGSGEPILLFPGFTCTGDVWDETVTILSKDYECHVFTFAGFGEVPPVEGETPWLTQIKDDVAHYIDVKQLDTPHLLGHSLGGSLSLWLASEHTEKYGSLVIVDGLPSIGALMMPNFKSENMVYDTPYNTQMLHMNDEAFGAMALQMANGMTQSKDKVTQLVQWMQQADRKTYVYGYTDLLKLDLRASIANIKNPVIVLAATFPYGEEMAKNTYTTQYEALKKYDLRMAEGSAHFIMYDQPEWFEAQIKQVFNVQ